LLKLFFIDFKILISILEESWHWHPWGGGRNGVGLRSTKCKVTWAKPAMGFRPTLSSCTICELALLHMVCQFGGMIFKTSYMLRYGAWRHCLK